MAKYAHLGYNGFMTTIDLPLLSNKRECGTCTKCCEGWLHATVRGHDMYVGKPCFFVEQGVGCSDYENRPSDPCKTFSCSWKEIPELPEKFKPEVSGVIIRYTDDSFFIIKAPEEPNAELISWMITYARGNNKNIVWYLNDGVYWLGSDQFCNKMKMEMENA